VGWTIRFHKRALKEAKRLPADVGKRLKEAMVILTEGPYPQNAKKLVNVIPDTCGLRFGDGRIIYQVDEPTETITITHVLHRREVYRKL